MKKLLLLLLVPLLLFSCLGKEEDSAEEPVVIEELEPELIETYTIYNGGLGIRETASGESDKVFYSNLLEKVYWTGESQEVGRHTWLEVQNEDGSEIGWCWEMYLAPNGIPFIMTDRMIIYSTPDALDVTDQFIEKYQIGAIVGEEGIYYEIKWAVGNSGYHGFIKKENISFGESAIQDIKILEIVRKAEEAESYEMAKELLNNALEFTSSSFYQEVRDASKALEAAQNIPVEIDQYGNGSFCLINSQGVNVRSLPSLEGNEIARLDQWTSVQVLESTSVAETIEGLGTGYWYRISFYQDGSQENTEAWVFGLFLNPDEGY